MPDTEHPNVAGVREALDAYAAADWDRMGKQLHDDIAWHVGGDNPLSGTYRGRDAAIAYFRKTQELTGGTLRLDVDEILANDQFGGIVLRAHGERAGKRLDVQMAEAVRFDQDGLWTEFWALSYDQSAVDEFWR